MSNDPKQPPQTPSHPNQHALPLHQELSYQNASSHCPPDICPSCRLRFDRGKKRRLVDSCGHARCYSCMFKRQECPICVEATSGFQPPKLQKSQSGGRLLSHANPHRLLSGPSLSALPPSQQASPATSRLISNGINGRARNQSPSPQSALDSIWGGKRGKPSLLASPRLQRSPWMQQQRRHNSGNNLSDQFQKTQQQQHHQQQHNPSSTQSRESGFQSSASLTSLEKRCQQLLSGKDSTVNGQGISPASTLTDSLGEEDDDSNNNRRNEEKLSRNGRVSADSMTSIISGLSDSASNTDPSRRHSLTTIKQSIVAGNMGRNGNVPQYAARRSTRVSRNQQFRLQIQDDCSLISAGFANGKGIPPDLTQLHWTLKPLFFEVPTAEANPVFVGRQWLFREVAENLSSDLPTNGGVVVSGGPGSGKTAVILQMVEHSCFGRAGEVKAADDLISGVESIYNQSQLSLALSSNSAHFVNSNSSSNRSLNDLASKMVAYHFCQSDNAPTCLVPEFVHSIAAQMTQSPQLTPYYQLVSSDARLQSLLSLPGCVADPSAAFVGGILEPLSALQRTGRLPHVDIALLVIDGLCEAEIHRLDHGPTLGNFLATHLPSFPSWLKIVCTVRSNCEAAAEVTRALPFQRISLDKTDVDERLNKDMADYISMRISRSDQITANITPSSGPTKLSQDQIGGAAASPQARITAYLTQVARGCFLYVKLSLDLLERGHLVVKSSSGFNVLPMTLAQIYLLECNLRFPSERSFDKVREVLQVALATLSPMTPVDLFNSVNALRKGKAIAWGEFLMRFSALSGFLVRRADDTVMFSHPTLREWLIRRREFESRKFICDPRAGHAAIALRMCRAEAPLGPDKTLELAHHILKAHIYRNSSPGSGEDGSMPEEDESIPSRDLQAAWVATSSDDVSSALGAVRNVSSPNTKVSRLLLLAGASPDAPTDFLDGAPLIGVFASQGFLDMVSLLIEFGADVDAPAVGGDGSTPLILASSKGHLEVVRLLVQQGAAVNLTDRRGTSALIAASKVGNIDVVNFLVSCDWMSNASSDLSLSEAAQQAVTVAAERGHEQVLEFLLDMAEVMADRPDTLSGSTALCAAALSGRRRCAEILMRRGAKASTADLRGRTPIHLSAQGGHWDVTEALLKESDNDKLMEAADADGRTPLIAAAAEGHAGLVELLLSRGAKVEGRDSQGLTALGWACLKGRSQAASCLLDHGADLAATDKSRRSPLCLASYKGDPEVVHLLLDRSAAMEHVDAEGMRPLDRAISSGHSAVVQCFLRKGAKLGPTTWSLANDKPEILTILLNKLLEDGNTLYRRGRHEEAAHRYSYALRRLPSDAQQQQDCEKQKVFEQMRVHLLLNLSRCKRKLGHPAEAVAKATEVLQFKPDSLEALHARARAYREADEYEKALSDLSDALKLSPHNREIQRFAVRVREELRISQSGNNNEGEIKGPVGVGQHFSFVDEALVDDDVSPKNC